MRKISILVLLSIIINIFSPVTIYAEEKNETALEFVKEKIAYIIDDIDMSEEDVDRYLSKYDNVNDFVYDLIKYKKYLEHNSDENISFENFKNNNYTTNFVNTHVYKSPRIVSDAILLSTPEQEVSYKNYINVSENERINYATGEFIYEETDLVLPGVNGLDLALTVRFNQEESALCRPGILPVMDGESYTYTTYMCGYSSEAEGRYDIGAGWSFTFPYVTKDEDRRDMYYVRLPDGSTAQADNSGFLSRRTKDITFECRGTNDYVLTYKNGNKDYLNDKGIIKTEDRYGNSIQYFYDSEGLIEKIIDSANRIITFERSKESEERVNIEVKVNGECMCEYRLEKYTNTRYKLVEKISKGNHILFFYDNNKVEVFAPKTYKSDFNTILTINEIVNFADNSSVQYEYEYASIIIESDDGSTGTKEFPRIKNRKKASTINSGGESVDEMNYQYSTNSKNWSTPYEISEVIAQTGMKTEYMTNDYFGLIRTKEITAPDTDVSIKIDYSYDDYNLMESYTQHTYSAQGENTVTESYEHDEKGNMISHTDRFGTQRMYTYDEDTSVIVRIDEPISRYGIDAVRYITNTFEPFPKK